MIFHAHITASYCPEAPSRCATRWRARRDMAMRWRAEEREIVNWRNAEYRERRRTVMIKITEFADGMNHLSDIIRHPQSALFSHVFFPPAASLFLLPLLSLFAATTARCRFHAARFSFTVFFLSSCSAYDCPSRGCPRQVRSAHCADGPSYLIRDAQQPDDTAGDVL